MPDTVVELLRFRAFDQPDAIAYTFLPTDDGVAQVSVTYSELDRRTRAVAALLQDVSASGERILLLYPPGLDYIVAFLGCLYAGRIAVPSYPPRLNRPDTRLQAIVADSQARVVLTTTAILSSMERRLIHTPGLDALAWRATDALDVAALADGWLPPALIADSLAFLQYTSGSTAIPKGVMVTHANLLHNQQMIRAAFGHDEHSVVVGWLPIYHDMGLIGNVLQPLYLGSRCILMAPVTFIRNPILWLQTISRYGAHSSGGPNFAYALCVQRTTPEQRAGLDLSTWRVAFNGAEPVRYETLAAFADAFAPYGFRRDAFYPCYGLAEATLFVSGRLPANPPVYHAFQKLRLERGQAALASPDAKDAQVLVGCGRSWPDETLAIVNPDTHVICPPGEVGEIWVAGPHVAQGYWEKPEETRCTFQATLAGSGEGPFLRTGDLGFLHGEELFVAGRIKDLIIIRGRNHYPQDIEFTVARSHPALQPDGGAAFSVDVAGEERLVVVQELSREQRHADVDAVAQAIRQAVAGEHALQVYAVVLLKPMSLPKTSSGKVQRRLCRTLFLENRLSAIGSSILGGVAASGGPDSTHDAMLQPALAALGSEEERRQLAARALQEQAAQVLRMPVDRIPLDQSLVTLGLDSLLAVELESRAASILGITAAAVDWLNGATLLQMANQSLTQLSAGAAMPIRSSEPGGRWPLSFEQERLWLLDQVQPGNPVYHIPLALRLEGPLDVASLEKSLRGVVDRHAILRASFHAESGRPVQVIAPPGPFALPLVDLRDLPEAGRDEAIRQLAADAATLPFDLGHGPLLQATLARRADDVWLLFLTLHHIAGDVASLGVLLQELAAFYRAFASGEPASLPDLPVHYGDFVRWQRERLQPETLQPLCAYWKGHLSGAPASLALPSLSLASGDQTPRTAQRFFEIPPLQVAALRALSRSAGVTLFTTLLAAFEVLLHQLTGQDDLVIGSPTDGRVRPEIRGLVGFFAYPLPLRADLAGNPSFLDLLQRVRQVALDGHAHRDAPFAKVVEATRPPRNGQPPLFQAMFSLARSPLEGVAMPGLALSRVNVASATDFGLFLTLLEEGDGLQGALGYDPALFDAGAADLLAAFYTDILARCAQHPETRLAHFAPPPLLAGRLPKTLAIAATFTAEPLKDPLAFWMQRLDIPARVEFAPYNQVFQQLLDPESLFSRNNRGCNIILVRFEDWLGAGGPDADPAASLPGVERAVGDLMAALSAAGSRFAEACTPVPHWVCITPASPAALAHDGLAAFFAQMESRLVAGLEALPDVYVATSAELHALYPVADYADSRADALGRIPYTPAFFTALGTLLARKLHALQRPPYKVIALDCDGTLWRGVCGEDGPLGVAVDPPWEALQAFMARQSQAGMLLCLCSKNDEADVRAVFEQHPDMPLKWEHLVARRINWRSKSENLRALAEELALGLDSFIFVDDNPVECAEVQAGCPEALALCLPQAERIPRFLEHVWAFDHVKVTGMDRRRAEFYRQDQERRRLAAEAPSFEAFLAGLELDVDIAGLAPEHLARAAQLTQRTNQFNCAPQRRTEGELQALCLDGAMEGRVVHVRDRFGDYGLVGLMLFSNGGASLTVDTFLLSCRALGRGVEQRMLSYLTDFAATHGLSQVAVRYLPTARNRPARDFLERVATREDADGEACRFLLDENPGLQAKRLS